MQGRFIRSVLAASALSFGFAAQAGFLNGGFEDGTFNGWTIRTGEYTGAAGGLAGINWNNNPAPRSIVGVGHTDPYSPFDAPFNDNFMAKINDVGGNYDVTELSQTGIMGVGESDLFINWGAVLVEPSNPHNDVDQPFFNITVKKNGSTIYNVSHDANDPGWQNYGSFGSPVGGRPWYGSGQVHLSGLLLNDSVEVIMTVTDCGLGGHGGYAFLDGIGTVYTPPPPGVPDGGATAFLILPALAGLGALRRRA